MQHTGRSETILVADDEPDLTDLYKIWLSHSYEVRTAYNGQEALDQFDQTVDVALLDRRMPGHSGEEVAARIAEIDPTTPIAFVSSEADPTIRSDVAYDAYLTKPIVQSELLDSVEELLDESMESGSSDGVREVAATDGPETPRGGREHPGNDFSDN